MKLFKIFDRVMTLGLYVYAALLVGSGLEFETAVLILFGAIGFRLSVIGEDIEARPSQKREDATEAIRLLRDLADLQNGPPLIRDEEEWGNTMKEVYVFLNEKEADYQLNADQASN